MGADILHNSTSLSISFYIFSNSISFLLPTRSYFSFLVVVKWLLHHFLCPFAFLVNLLKISCFFLIPCSLFQTDRPFCIAAADVVVMIEKELFILWTILIYFDSKSNRNFWTFFFFFIIFWCNYFNTHKGIKMGRSFALVWWLGPKGKKCLDLIAIFVTFSPSK